MVFGSIEPKYVRGKREKKKEGKEGRREGRKEGRQGGREKGREEGKYILETCSYLGGQILV